MCALMMTGCAWWKRPGVEPPLQANLLQRCPEFLTEHTGTDGKAVFRTMTNWPLEYNECAARHNGLVDAVQKKESK